MSSSATPSARANPMEALEGLDDFRPTPSGARREVPAAVIDAVAASEGFPSRQAAAPSAGSLASGGQRHHTTGRNVQINLKGSQETKERLARLAYLLEEPMAAVVERALLELELRVTPRKQRKA